MLIKETTATWYKFKLPGSLCILLQLKGGVCILVAIDIIGIFNLEKKVFSLYLCIVRTPQFDIILPEKKCVLYMGKNGTVKSCA